MITSITLNNYKNNVVGVWNPVYKTIFDPDVWSKCLIQLSIPIKAGTLLIYPRCQGNKVNNKYNMPAYFSRPPPLPLLIYVISQFWNEILLYFCSLSKYYYVYVEAYKDMRIFMGGGM